MRTLPFFTTALLVSSLSLASGRANAQIVMTFAGSGSAGSADGPAGVASFNGPKGVAVDWSGSVYVADSENLEIRKIAPDGAVTTVVKLGPPLYYGGPPTGVAVDSSGNLYAVDPDGDGYDGGDLRKVTPGGVVGWFASSWPTVEAPTSVAVDSAGNLFVTDLYNGLVRVSATGAPTVLARDLTSAWGVAVDGAGVVYVADTAHHRIVKVTADGAVTSLAGSGGRGSQDGVGSAASFSGPTGVAVDNAGNVYVADTGNNLIRRIAPGGVVTTLAGTGVAGRTDGAPGIATFNAPSGVALDAAGNLYVADTGNNLIRKITAATIGCGVGCTNWTVPSVAHIAGADGSFWTSDLVLHNRGNAPAPVTLKFLGNSRDGTSGPEKSFTLDPFQTVTYADVLSSVFGIADDAGALEVLTPSDQLTVRSRTFTAAAGGTVGDGMPGVRQGSFFTDQTTPVPVLIGLTEDGRFRSNLILVNGTASPLDVRVDAIDASGAAIGNRTYTLPPLGMIQDSRFLIEAEFGGQPKTGATVTLSSPTPGAAFTASAVVIDNGSNAPTTVLPQ